MLMFTNPERLDNKDDPIVDAWISLGKENRRNLTEDWGQVRMGTSGIRLKGWRERGDWKRGAFG